MTYKEFMEKLKRLKKKKYCNFCAHVLTKENTCNNPRCLNYTEEAGEPKRTLKERIDLLDSGLLTEEEIHLPKQKADLIIAKRKKEKESGSPAREDVNTEVHNSDNNNNNENKNP